VDDPGRENEGDLIIAAEALTEEKMAFMVRYTRYMRFHCDLIAVPYQAKTMHSS
jgi:3,4-dihydroxy-2-butanone 4-phosphate synthase